MILSDTCAGIVLRMSWLECSREDVVRKGMEEEIKLKFKKMNAHKKIQNQMFMYHIIQLYSQ